jgi:hypothetical protein
VGAVGFHDPLLCSWKCPSATISLDNFADALTEVIKLAVFASCQASSHWW